MKKTPREKILFLIFTQKIQLKIQKEGSLQLQQIVPTSVIKQWHALLSSNDNKNKIISFLVKEQKELHDKIGSKTFYVNNRKEAFRITSEGASREEVLDGDHQEADTRIFTQVLHASSTNNKILISSPDTNVFMIAVAKFEDIPADRCMLTGTKNSTCILDKKRVAGAFFDVYCEIDTIDKLKIFKSLLGYRCFTGCNSISAFCGKGKIKALSVFWMDGSYIQAFYNLGQTNEFSEETILSLQLFVYHLCGKSFN